MTDRIQFNQIPVGIKKPGGYVEYDSSGAMTGLPANAQKVLLIGYCGPATKDAFRDVPFQVASAAEAFDVFNASQVYFMVRAAFAANPLADVWALPIAPPVEGTQAVASLAFPSSGPLTSGTAVLWVGGVPVPFSLQITDSAATAVGKLYDALMEASKNNIIEVVPTIDNILDLITLTALQKGAHGNQIALTLDNGGTGVPLVVPAALTTGTGVPTLTTALANAFPSRYDKIVCGFNDEATLAVLKTHLDEAAGWSEQRGQVGVAGFAGTVSDAVALALTANSERMVLACLEKTNSTPWAVASAFAAVVAGESDPARPLQTLPLAGIAPPPALYRYTRTEEETLLAGGCTPLGVGPGESVQIVRAVTTYTLNAAGASDPAYLDLTTITTLDYLRDAWRQRMALRFPRSKLNDRTVQSVRDETLALLRLMGEAEIIEHVEDNKDSVIVLRDLMDVNRLDVQIPADVVNGLVVLAAKIDLIL